MSHGAALHGEEVDLCDAESTEAKDKGHVATATQEVVGSVLYVRRPCYLLDAWMQYTCAECGTTQCRDAIHCGGASMLLVRPQRLKLFIR
jgi:hypothetical protein